MKQLLKNYITEAVLLIILGFILLLWPGATLEICCRIIGAVLLLIGVVKILQFALIKDGENHTFVSLAIGIVLAALGLWLLIYPSFFIGLFPFLAAVIIAAGAILSLIKTLKHKDGGSTQRIVSIILSIITLILAVIVILHPTVIASIILQFIGVSLIVEGITLLVSLSR